MRTLNLVSKELERRKLKLGASILAVVLGISILVATETIGEAMYKKTKQELYNFGANIIVQPKSKSVDAYFGAVTGEGTLPESYVNKIEETEHADMLRAISPKLYQYFDIGDRKILVVGITDAEKKMKVWWRINGLLVKEFPKEKEVLLGHYAASRLENPTQINIGNEIFKVTGILDETGSRDDYMAFIPLGKLQEIIEKRGLVSVIEISSGCIACPSMNINDHAREIDEVIPDDARVVTVKQISEAQISTLTRIENLIFAISLVMIGLSLFVVMNYMFSSVSEQRYEIGILLAIGMNSNLIYKIFLIKALMIGIIGGVLGYLLGTGISIVVGPKIAGTGISPLFEFLPYSLLLATIICIISSILPARRAAKLDPVKALQVS